LNVAQPEDSLDSTADVNYLVRSQLAVSFAYSLPLPILHIDFGVTPKVSEDRLEENEVVENSFTFDVGAAASLTALPLRLGAVLKNVVTESITTKDGFEFETTPQLIVGAVFDLPVIALNADLALNEAKVDNFETQLLAIGAEFTPLPLFALRAGISSDLSSSETALSLGVGAVLKMPS